ncbi:hypothetical protein MG293_010190 [Ovis ammon polii]|uniref:Uncharacterized protein n=1 Tax=Ovis ammon polii TaxID=230172 RepID=A0AAD4UA24_OVIAM|nr:hypothetical protein MG293_010190 [Ovis ammon polii]
MVCHHQPGHSSIFFFTYLMGLSGTKQSECRKPGFHKQTDAKFRPVFRSIAKLCFLLGVDFRAVLYCQDLNQVYPPQTRPGYRFLLHFLAPLLSSEDTTKGALLISGLPVTSLGTEDTDPVTSVPRNRPEENSSCGLERENKSKGTQQPDEQCGAGCGEKEGFGDERTQVEEKENQVFSLQKVLALKDLKIFANARFREYLQIYEIVKNTGADSGSISKSDRLVVVVQVAREGG